MSNTTKTNTVPSKKSFIYCLEKYMQQRVPSSDLLLNIFAFREMDLEFEDIVYDVKRRWRDKGSRTILNGISGCFKSGELSAILGPSGAGKSTLLNILSGYKMKGVKGTFKINGEPIDRKIFHKASRYITQEDLLPNYLTTEEAMLIATSLKLPKTTGKKQREMVVEETLSLLGLYEARQTRVELLSGGQKKRLSIALEMINNPSVFFLDEPTSGLDNVSTTQSLKLLSKLSKQGRTIVCTIHQPSASIFELFDNVYFLANGKCIYQGAATQLLPFLSSKGFLCPTYHNPADFVMDVIDTDNRNIDIMCEAMRNGKTSHSNNNVVNVIERYHPAAGERGLEMKTLKDNANEKTYKWIVNNNLEKKPQDEWSSNQNYPINCFDQFIILVKRMFKQNSRNVESLQILVFHHFLCAFLVGSVFYKTANDAHQMFNHLKFCVGYVLFHTYTNIMLPVLIFPAEVKLLKKEHFNRWYSLNSYYAATIVIKLPTQILLGTIFSAIVYFMSGLPAEPLRFLLFTAIGILVTFVADATGMFIGSIFNVTNGSAVGPAVVAPFLGLAVYGFDFAREVPWITYAIMKLSFMRCAVIATALTLFGFGRETLDCNEVYCHFKEPKVVLHFLDVEHSSIWNEFFALSLLLVFFRIISYLALKNRLAVN